MSSKKPVIASLTFRSGDANVYTPSCGCCSDWYTEDNKDLPNGWPFDDDDLIKHVEIEEARVEALREDLNDYLSKKDN